MPVFYITAEETKKNKDITAFIKNKYRADLNVRLWSENKKIIDMLPKYSDMEENQEIWEDDDELVKKDYTENHLWLLIWSIKWKSKDEIMKKVLSIKKEYNIPKDIQDKIDTLLSSL